MGARSGNPLWEDYPSTDTPVTATALENIETALDGLAAPPINAQTGTTYTLVAADAGKLVTLTNAAAITLTVPGNVFTAGQRVDVLVAGAGMVTVVGSSCTINPEAGMALVSRAQYSAFTIMFLTATTAFVTGSMAAA